METFFLVGFEGCGKKTIASLLASRKNIQYIDIEKLIEHDERTSIYNIENFKGNMYLKQKITEILNNISKVDNVISTPTYICLDEENRNMMLKKGKVIYLQANAETIMQHMKDSYKENLILQYNFEKTKIQNMIDSIKNFYIMSSNIVIDVNNKNIHEVFNEVLFQYNVVNMLHCHIHIK